LKWVALILLLSAIGPLATWLRRNPDQVPKVWMLIGFLPFVLTNLHLYIAVYSWAGWTGYVQGAEVSLLDALAIVLYLILPSSRRSLPFRLSMALYFIAVLLSSFEAEFPVAALLYSWQLARMFLIYAVVSRGVADPRVAPALLTGMAAAIFIEAGFAVWERFGLGVLQASGSMEHQNTLGLMSHFVIFPFFALLLARRRGWLPPAVLLAGLVIEVLTGSRATVGLAGLGYTMIFVVSAVRRWSLRKATILLVGVITIAIALPVALASFAQRGEVNLESSNDERVALESAAAAMVADHPWGVGANHFAIAANLGGYYARAGVSWHSFAAQVHNVYWLVAGETGYLGLVTLLFLLLHPAIVALICSWRYRGDERCDLLLGLGVALLMVYIHSAFEWILLLFEAQYLLAIDLGLVAGLAQQLGYWSRKFPQAYPFSGRSNPRPLTKNML
jgi:O-Antigen ligase